jgi:eukaryotic-like serine/threonine-protein kinase
MHVIAHRGRESGTMLVGQKIGPFEIEKELGSGAMGTVYRAKFQRSEDKVIPIALKVVALGLLGNEGAMARFEREANILKQLKHPHIVRLIAHGKINKSNPYIAMEFIDGEALDRVLARRGKLSWEEVATYGKQLCEALQYAHDKGIIHRDLKPSNLMITKDGKLKLTDFGIAKDTDVTALTGANSTIGTAAYMSPEQCKGDKNLSNKSDLYSLGIVMFELLSGRKPFVAETTVDMFLKHVNEPPPRIGKFVAELPTKFEALINQLLEKETHARPIDAAWVARFLHEVEEDAFARKSAGLAVAEGRGLKKTNADGGKLDADDKEAARALRGTKKKTKKKKAVPLLEQKWVKAAGLIAILLALGLGTWLALKPPSADKLFAQIEKASADDKAEAAAKYLDALGDKRDFADPQVAQAARLFRDATVRARERQLANRFAAKRDKPDENDDGEAYTSAYLALTAEAAGQLEAAEAQWTKVKLRFPEEAKLQYATAGEQLAKARWGWLADKRAADLVAVKSETARLRKKITEARLYETSLKGDAGNPEALAIRALRFREFGDIDRVARTCDTLVALTEKDADRRTFYLIATQQKAGAGAPPQGPDKVRQKLVADAVSAASKRADELKDDPERKAERRDARNALREVQELYDDDTDPAVLKDVARAAAAAKLVQP